MTNIDFYLLSDEAGSAKSHIACRLADKAFRLGNRVYVLTEDEVQARELDQLLWTFRPGSFVPHGLHSKTGNNDLPVVIGRQEPSEEFTDVLISLATDMLAFFSRFDRVAEVVGTTEEEKRNARERYRFYRDRGYALQTHDL